MPAIAQLTFSASDRGGGIMASIKLVRQVVQTLILGGGAIGYGMLGGGGAAGASVSAGAHSTTQRTLTIVVKFDAAHRVRDIAYRQSSF